MRIAPWLYGIILLSTTVAHAAPDSATLNDNTAVAISGLVGGAGSSGIRPELAAVSGNIKFENLSTSEGSGSPRQAMLDVANVNSIPETTPFILAGIFVASFYVGRKFRVKAV